MKSFDLAVFAPETRLIWFLAVSFIMGAIHRRLSSCGSFLAILYCLPFTIMHEIAHFLVAWLTGGRPSSLCVWPKRSGHGWVLGSVRSTPTLFSAAPTALAPLAWLALGYCAMLAWELRPRWLPEWLIVVILYACAAASTPSWQDIKVALTHPLSLVLYAAAVYIIVVTLAHQL